MLSFINKFGVRASQPQITIWGDAPELAIPEAPALLTDCSDLWLAYETTADPRGEVYAIVRFHQVIDHRLSPINDEGIGQHPYGKFGLKWYSFNEVIGSTEAARWCMLGARHWVITFKDDTLDVLAASATVVRKDIRASSSLAALLSVLPCAE
jgi:hypothetical protein